jgi:hypothetical protein
LNLSVFNNISKKYSYQYTAKDGRFRAFAIVNESVTIKAYCPQNNGTQSNLVKTFSIAANTQNTNLGNLIVDSLTVIKGKIIDCNGNPVTNGYVVIKETSKQIPLNSDGTFRYYADFDGFTGTQITVTPYGNGFVGNTKIFNIKSLDINDLGDILLCQNNNTSSYISIKFNNKDYYFDQQPKVEESSSNITFFAEKLDGDGYRSCIFNIKKPIALNIKYQLDNIIMIAQNGSGGKLDELINCSDCLNATISTNNTTEVKGTIVGTDKDGKSVTGSFYFKK